jgi:uncharacterized repeat protein (TIGR04042 family)
MPSVNFTVNWPDGDTVNYYSPSTVIHQYLKIDTDYELSEFKEKVDGALDAASERVKASFGFYCSAASDEQLKIQDKFSQLINTHKNGKVSITAFTQ